MLTPYQWNLFRTARRKLSRWLFLPESPGEPPSKTIAPSENELSCKNLARQFEAIMVRVMSCREPRLYLENAVEVADAVIEVLDYQAKGYDAIPWIQEIFHDLFDAKTPGVASSKLAQLQTMFQERRGTVQ